MEYIYNNENLANKNVTFTVYRTIGGATGKAIYVGNAMTDSNGTAILKYRAPAEDGCKVVASYNGEELISGCSGSGTISLSRYGAKNTRMYGQAVRACNGETVNLTSQLTDSNGVPIVNKSITFRINDEIVGSAVTDQNGTANLPYNVTQTKGIYNLDACFYGDGSYDNCIGSGNLFVNPIQTQVTVNNITSYYGSDTNLTAKLTDSKGNPLVNKVVSFKINNGSAITASTDINGVATIPYTVSETRAKYSIEVDFNGDDVYDGCAGNGTLSTNPNTIIKISNVTGNPGSQIFLTANISNVNRTSLANKNIVFSIDGNVVGSAVTNSNGTAVLPYNISQGEGNYTIKAEFNGDELYDSSTGTANLKVDTIDTNLKVNSITTNKGKTVQLTAQLTDNNNKPLANQKITFKINNTVIGSVTTNSDGITVLSYLVKLSKGQYSIMVQFAGNDLYSKIQGTALLKVK